MRKISFLLGLLLFYGWNSASAAEGYRYMHVSIDTPWTIFLFLLAIVLFPFILMAILYWYFAFKEQDEIKVPKQPEAKATEISDAASPANNAE